MLVRCTQSQVQVPDALVLQRCQQARVRSHVQIQVTSERVAGEPTDFSRICNCGVSIVFCTTCTRGTCTTWTLGTGGSRRVATGASATYSMTRVETASSFTNKCWCNSRGAGRSVRVRGATDRISSLDLSFSFQLSEKTFGPNRVHVPKDVESDVQRLMPSTFSPVQQALEIRVEKRTGTNAVLSTSCDQKSIGRICSSIDTAYLL